MRFSCFMARPSCPQATASLMGNTRHANETGPELMNPGPVRRLPWKGLLLYRDLVVDALDVINGARELSGRAPGLRVVHEARQLHHARLGFHVDLVCLGPWIPCERRLDLRRDHAVIDDLVSRTVLRAH